MKTNPHIYARDCGQPSDGATHRSETWSPRADVAPWDKLLILRDPILEAGYWTGRFRTQLTVDRVSSFMAMVVSAASYFRLEGSLHTNIIVSLLPVLFSACLVLASFSGDVYARRRTLFVAVHSFFMVVSVSFSHTVLRAPEGSASAVVVRTLVNSNPCMLLMQTFTTQLSFRDYCWVELLSTLAAMQFSPFYCSSWLTADRALFTSTLRAMAKRIEDTYWTLVAMQPVSAADNHLDARDVCWQVLSFFQCGAFILGCAVLYCVECRSKALYLLSKEEGTGKTSGFVWRAWRMTVVMALWACLVGLMMVWATLRAVLSASVSVPPFSI